MESKALRAVALVSSVSIGVFLVARANSGCSSETQSVAQPEVPSTATSAPPTGSDAPAAVTAEEQFFQGSKAPGGTGTRGLFPKGSSSAATEDEEFFGTSKSGRIIRPKQSGSPNAPNPAPQPQPQQ